MFKWSAEGALNEGRAWVGTVHLVVTILAQGEARGGGGRGSGMLDYCTAVYEVILACILCWQWSNNLLQFVSF